MSGAWPEWSEAEHEEHGSENEECRATEEQERVAQQTLGQPVAKAKSLLDGGKVPPSENTKPAGQSKKGNESSG